MGFIKSVSTVAGSVGFVRHYAVVSQAGITLFDAHFARIF
jgi:hypothetical protein